MEHGSRCITKHFLEKCRKTVLFRKVPQNIVRKPCKKTLLPSDDEPAFTNDEFTVNYTMTDEQKEIAETTGKKYGFLSCVLKRSNMYFTFIDTEGEEYSEKNTRTGTRRTGTRRTGRKSGRKSGRKGTRKSTRKNYN